MPCVVVHVVVIVLVERPIVSITSIYSHDGLKCMLQRIMALHPRVSKAYKLGLERINGRLMGTHQHLGVQWMLKNELLDDKCKGGLLADDCGCGKTYITLCVFKGNPVPTTLIVTMVSLIHQWRDIITTFARTSPFIVSSDCMVKVIPPGTNIVLATYSMFAPKKKKQKIPPILQNTKWDRIILDEGHIIKNRAGTTFQNINGLTSSIRWVLSATPMQNSIKDIVTLASWIGWSDRDGTIDHFIANKVLRRTLASEGEKNPRFKLPRLDSKVVRLRFNMPQERHVYESVENEFQTRIEQTSEGYKLYTEALQGILRCRQVCCHYLLLDRPLSKRQRILKDSGSNGSSGGSDGSSDKDGSCSSSTKISYICDDIANNSNEKSLVFCMWTKEIAFMMACLEERGVSAMKFDGSMTKEKRENALYNFKNTGVQALVIQIQAGGVGLNLQCATRVYITSPTWNPTHEIQAICRSHRLGQDHIVKCFRLIIEDTIEERMLEIQNKKLTLIADALDDQEVIRKMCDGNLIEFRDLFKKPQST
jgi:SNF2 family DNA or RNA helicase